MSKKRTQIYLEEKQGRELASLARSRGTSQSEIIRQAIDIYLARMEGLDKGAAIDEVAGIWADRKDLPDVEKLRKEWVERNDRSS